jgi:glycosyltransferase involved in cell wall biosynthesis
MGDSPLLGICIPVYKRPYHLVECLRSIAVASKDYDIPVFILDDSCDDSNIDAIKTIRGFYPNIVYRRNKNNIGIDRNILKAVDTCTASYAWILGEDDRLLPEAIRTVTRALTHERKRCPFLFVNYRMVNHDYSLVLKSHAVDRISNAEMSIDCFLQHYAWAIGFIGACIVKRDLWEQVDQTPYLDTYFAHVGVILYYLRQFRYLRFIGKPLVLNRCGEARIFSWKEDVFNVMDGWQRMMDKLVPIYGQELCRLAKDSFAHAHGSDSLKFLMYLRADATYDLNLYQRRIHPGRHHTVFKHLAKAIAICPPIAFKAARSVINGYRRITSTFQPL